ncbi:hypothetical protein DSM106972_022610 [Dulcicalothrix desertica PCC 7102]|uniref:Carrier domain-containing protein n=1 Tax=Dulcicalothrix desertica PCC 7102 TaxID=232991 RepID=A0A3S1AQX1_9CYAN|nr:amino acid adenylation domain-containing protein [Dulcicalothrix desertica]RUT07000.1 hypothetical protein DSM106972_022610 [Dulcicalothrix desertica PCC 7102]TWH61999.1 amino acid adenylation domain-containing protein/thioester reductase-like protein [Dulcicalothrix desertica PCC 7102]
MNNQNLQLHYTIVSLIELIFQQYPNSVALVFGEQQLTYREFHQRAECLYNYLTAQGLLKPNTLIGLCVEPSFEMVIAIYTILKAGAAFVPLDPDLPRQRLSYTVADAKLTTILTSRKFAFDIEPALRQSSLNGRMCFLDSEEVWQNQDVSSPAPTVEADQLAYIIYTSGSTGTPKGVAIAHRGLLNHTLASCDIYDIQPKSRILQFASISFDSSIAEIAISLCSGATLVLGAREEMLPGQPLASFIAKHRVQMMILPPSVLATLTQFRNELSDLRLIIVGGEACPLSLAKSWISSTTKLFNVYGPTEITIYGTMYAFNADDISMPIGYALPNVETYILDEELKLCAAGEKGELYVGGVGIAVGYWNKPELTSTRFLDNPYSSGKIYKTGDIVYEDTDKPGLLHFVGRIDNQVKIRGNRVEVEAIESLLTQHPDVLSAAVKAIRTQTTNSDLPENYGMSMLVAYIVSRAGKFITEKHLQRFVAEQLPEYMVPTRFVFMDELPLLPNRSKVDRNALPELQQAPSFDIDIKDNKTKIAAIFDETLFLTPGSCTPDSNFFHMGGSSLCVAHLLFAIARDFGVKIPSRLIYEYATPLDLAKLLERYHLQTEDVMDNDRHLYLDDAKLSLELHTSWQQPEQVKYNCALVTGVTGYLGSHLLHELLQKGRYQKIYCLVRAEDYTEALLRLRTTFIKYQLPILKLSQVVVITGDIQQPQLQLPVDIYNKLAEEIDCVYHVAADTNYIKPYSAMKKPNIEGTANIISFASYRRHKILHYVSTLAVYGSTTSLLGIEEVSEDLNISITAPIMSVEYAYVRAKWAAEYMVHMAREKGLAVSIYRPGFISGHEQKTGVINRDDMFYRFVTGCTQMGLCPYLPLKYWNPVPVDYVATVIAHISLDADHTSKNYNILLPREHELSNDRIFKVINSLGYSVESVSLKNWLNALSSISPQNAIHPLISFLQEKVYQNRSTILEVHHCTPIFRADNTSKAIAQFGIECPKFDTTLLGHYLPNFVRDVTKEPVFICP